MRGPVNTKIRLKIMRKGVDKLTEVTIVRDIIRVRSVRSRIESDEVAYVRVTQFNEQTTDGVKKALSDMQAQMGDKLKGFVLDLRNNPGGLLDQAISVSDAFLEKGEIVDPRPQRRGRSASTRGRRPQETSRSSCSSTAARLRHRRSWPAPCRITSARPSSALARSARARCRPSYRSAPAMVPCGSPPRAQAHLGPVRSRPRASRPISRCCRTCRKR